MHTRQVVIVAIGIGVIAISLWLSGFLSSLKEEPETEVPPEVRRYVSTEKVLYRPTPTEVVAFGRVRTAQSLDIIAEVQGKMLEGAVPLKEGQRFHKGTLLCQIDDTEARLNLQAMKSNFLRDLAAILPDIKIDYTESFDTWQKYFENIRMDEPIRDLPEYRSTKEKTFLATRNIFSSFYNIKSAEVNLAKHRMYAPFDGVIATVNLQSGSFVNPGSTIARLLRSDKLELKVDVSTKDIRWIDMGTEATVMSEDGQHAWKAHVVRIGDFVNETTQSIDVFLAINERAENMYDGEYLMARIPGKIIESGMEFPRHAIFNQDQVFVLQDSILRVHTITIQKLNNETAIINGLQEGLDVVVEPLINAHNNMKAYPRTKEGKDIDLELKSNRKEEDPKTS